MPHSNSRHGARARGGLAMVWDGKDGVVDGGRIQAVGLVVMPNCVTNDLRIPLISRSCASLPLLDWFAIHVSEVPEIRDGFSGWKLVRVVLRFALVVHAIEVDIALISKDVHEVTL